MITYKYKYKRAIMEVYMDGRLVGHIKKQGTCEFQYFPNGQKIGSQMFNSVANCKRFLEEK